MTVAFIEINPAPRNRGKVLELLRFSAQRLSTKPQCLGAGVYEAVDGKDTILYIERWETEEAHHHHLKSDLFFGVLTAIDMAQSLPEVAFYQVSSTASMDLVVELRGHRNLKSA